MKIELGTLRQSPFVGIFSVATEKMAFVPEGISKKEEKRMQSLFGKEVLRIGIAKSPLLGVLAAGNSKGLLVASIAEQQEIDALEQAGVKAKAVEGITAVGNLFACNDSKGICSSVFSEAQRKEAENFLGINVLKATVAGNDVVGSSIVATNKGFVLNKMASEKEAEEIEKHFGVPGALGTANSGDAFVGNSLVADSQACLAGNATTGFELARIDEGLRG